MTPSARLAAAIEVLGDIDAKRRPANDTLKDWGLSHRFAGSGDRAAIAGLVYDALRRRASSSWLMGESTPRAVALGMLQRERGLDTDAIARLTEGSRHAPAPLTDDERARLGAANMVGAPGHVLGDYPEWLDPYLARTFGEERAEEGAALASRAPLDLRVNTLKGDRDEALAELADLAPEPTRWSPLGLRIKLKADSKSPAVHAEPAYLKGLIEIQDEGSQLAALLARAKPGDQVLDLCAGGGGKSLALAAAMENKGRLIACDVSVGRLERSKLRLRRSGVHNATLRILEDNDKWVRRQAGGFDRVLVDAPCSGTGAWRRNPDARWHLKPENLESLRATQDSVLDQGAPLVKLGGRLIYATCSLLPEENTQRVEAFLARHPSFRPVPVAEVWASVLTTPSPTADTFLTLTPYRHGTDGFFVAVLERVA